MGISPDAWFLGVIGLAGSVGSVVLGFMLSGVRRTQTALWDAINEARRDHTEHVGQFRELKGRCDAVFGHKRNDRT